MAELVHPRQPSVKPYFSRTARVMHTCLGIASARCGGGMSACKDSSTCMSTCGWCGCSCTGPRTACSRTRHGVNFSPSTASLSHLSSSGFLRMFRVLYTPSWLATMNSPELDRYPTTMPVCQRLSSFASFPGGATLRICTDSANSKPSILDLFPFILS